MSGYIPFNRPHVTGREFAYIGEAIEGGHLSGNGAFTRRCSDWLNRELGCSASLLTHSCTGALEMGAILADLEPGDEVIMPSFTFVSTANAFVLRGAVPVFVDVRPDTLNLDEAQLEEAIGKRTRAIVPVHYAGVGCEMDAIMEVAEEHELLVIEDAAQALGATYRGRRLGGIGHLGAISFHETKNVMCGEGGALAINGPKWVERAQMIHDKGTNRAQFFRGQVDKYTWTDLGSSYPPSEINAAFLWAQLEQAEVITERRLALWNRYHEGFAELERQSAIRRPIMPGHCAHNAHMYYLLVEQADLRDPLIVELERLGVNTVFHYVPLHSSPAGSRFGRAVGGLEQTTCASERLLRMPLWVDMADSDVDRAVEAVHEALGTLLGGRSGNGSTPRRVSPARLPQDDKR